MDQQKGYGQKSSHTAGLPDKPARLAFELLVLNTAEKPLSPFKTTWNATSKTFLKRGNKNKEGYMMSEESDVTCKARGLRWPLDEPDGT